MMQNSIEVICTMQRISVDWKQISHLSWPYQYFKKQTSWLKCNTILNFSIYSSKPSPCVSSNKPWTVKSSSSNSKMTTSVLHLSSAHPDLSGSKSVSSTTPQAANSTANVKPGLPSPSTSETSDYQRSTPSPANEDHFRALSMSLVLIFVSCFVLLIIVL